MANFDRCRFLSATVTQQHRVREIVAIFFLVACVVAWRPTFAAPPDQPDKKPVPLQDLLQRFDKLSPEARLQLVVKTIKPEEAFEPVAKGDVVLSFVARGSLESSDNGNVYCELKAGTRGSAAATMIKAIVDDGVMVKKGDEVVLLDSSAFQERLKEKTKDHERAVAEKNTAQAALDVQKLQNQVDVLDSEIGLKVAEQDLKKYNGKDNVEKEILKMKVEKARLSVQLAKATAKMNLVQAEDELKAKTEAADAEMAGIQNLKDQIEKCHIKAPRDGMVVLGKDVGIRELIHYGQVLLQIPDLNKIQARILVPDSLAVQVEKRNMEGDGRPALVVVDAYPKFTLNGSVVFVDSMPAKEKLPSGEKLYKTLIKIGKDQNPKMPRLLPGMSAEVTVELDQKTGVLRVPTSAVVSVGKERFCYVTVGKEIQKRDVEVGLQTDQYFEIKAGVMVGDMVVRDVEALLRRLNLTADPPAEKKDREK
jgi:RND family efflux transporter MFP subunit